MSSRSQTFLDLLDEEGPEQRLPLYSFRHLCSQGVPDSPRDLRAQAWRVLLGLVDPSRDKRTWRQDLNAKRRKYADLAEEVCSRVDHDEHTSPIQLQKQDRLLGEILNDVVRTQSAFAFFLETVDAPTFASRRALLDRVDALKARGIDGKTTGRASVASTSSRASLNSLASSSNASFRRSDSPYTSATSVPSDSEVLWEGLYRLLFVFAALNPAIGYVQGLNELAAPLLYVFGQEDTAHAEADTFWALSALVNSGLGDLLSPENDQNRSALGLGMAVASLADQLHEADQTLSLHLQDVDVRPGFYVVRWLLAGFAQDFALPDLLRLWDALLAEVPNTDRDGLIPPPIQLLLDIAIAVVTSQREKLLGRSFPVCLRVIQNAPSTLNVDDLLTSAFLARQRRQAAAFERDNGSPATRFSSARKALSSLPTSAQASSWFSRKVNNFSETDASASLSKAATNLAVRSIQIRDAAPTRFEQLKADVAARAAAAKTSASAMIVRPPSPEYDLPFRPPGSSPSQSPESNSPEQRYSVPDYLATPPPATHGTGVKPLLLSSAARRAQPSEDGSTSDVEGAKSRRSSWLGANANGSPMPYANGRISPRPPSPVQALRSPPAMPTKALDEMAISSPRLGGPRGMRRRRSRSTDLDEPFTPPAMPAATRRTDVLDEPFDPPRPTLDPPFEPPYPSPTYADSPTKLVSIPPRRSSFLPPSEPRERTPSPPPPAPRLSLDDHDFHAAGELEPTPVPSPTRPRYNLSDTPASRLAESHPTQAPPSARPPRGVSLSQSVGPGGSSPVKEKEAAPLRRSRIMASARKRLSSSSKASSVETDKRWSAATSTSSGVAGGGPDEGDDGEDDVLAYYR